MYIVCRVNIAQWQHIVYNEWLPNVLGQEYMQVGILYTQYIIIYMTAFNNYLQLLYSEIKGILLY